ncbi:MAG: hypothetical protein ACFFD6_11150 [Candidatus Thorarchaeota archaeon]
MGLMDLLFGPYQRFGMRGGIVLLILVAIVGGIFAVWMMTIGAEIGAALSFVLDLTLTYGLLVLFLYKMWYRRPQ